MSQLGDLSTGFDSSAVIAIRVGSYTIVGIVVIFCVILCVCVKHVCASDRALRLPRSGAVLTASDPVFFPRCGLSSVILKALPVTVFHFSEKKLECAVCLCKLSDGEQVRILPKCNHGFHVECIDMWFESHSTCPLCRSLVEIKPTPDSTTDGIPASEVVFSLTESSASIVPANINGGEDQITTAAGQPASSSVSASVKSEGMLVVDKPGLRIEEFSLSSTPIPTPETSKTPISERRRTPTKVLSREKRTVAPFSASPGDGSGDIEQGLRGVAGENLRAQ